MYTFTLARTEQFNNQVTQEIYGLFDFMQHTYGLFGFDFHLELSTRPEKYLGTLETWDRAEAVRNHPTSSIVHRLTCFHLSNYVMPLKPNTPVNGR